MSAGDLSRALDGFRFIENPRLEVRTLIRRPRSKKYRIRKKWANRPGNLRREPSDILFYMHDKKLVMGHPVTVAALRARLEASAAAAGRGDK